MPCDETPAPDEAARPYAERIARAKLDAALNELGDTAGRRILTADTVVWKDEASAPLGKPPDADACHQMLRSIGGPQGHRVTTAWGLATESADIEIHSETTRVWFRPLSDGEVREYLQTDAWRDKAGGYGIQAEAAGWVTRIEGSYTNVVGLPVAQVLARLQEQAS